MQQYALSLAVTKKVVNLENQASQRAFGGGDVENTVAW